MTDIVRAYTHFAWIRDMRGGFQPQLWTENLTVTKPGCGTTYRADCVRFMAERTAFVVEIPPGAMPDSLEVAARMWSISNLTGRQLV